MTRLAVTTPPTRGAAMRRIVSEPVPAPHMIGSRPMTSDHCVDANSVVGGLRSQSVSKCIQRRVLHGAKPNSRHRWWSVGEAATYKGQARSMTGFHGRKKCLGSEKVVVEPIFQRGLQCRDRRLGGILSERNKALRGDNMVDGVPVDRACDRLTSFVGSIFSGKITDDTQERLRTINRERLLEILKIFASTRDTDDCGPCIKVFPHNARTNNSSRPNHDHIFFSEHH